VGVKYINTLHDPSPTPFTLNYSMYILICEPETAARAGG